MRSAMSTTKVSMLISHPFLLLRLVLFIVLFLLNALALSFAAFNITSSRTWEHFVSIGPALTIFNSSLFLFLSMLLLGERKYSHAIPPVSMVLVEVCWTTIMTVLTFVSSVLSTRYGLTDMCPSTLLNLATCSSSIMLLPVLWMNFFIFFAYSVTLLIVALVHAPLVPGIWCSNISEIPWFEFSASRITNGSDKSDLEAQAVSDNAFHPAPEIKHSGDDQQQSLKTPSKRPWLPRGSLAISVASFTPAWAKQYNRGLTRGLHNPFSRPHDDDATDDQTIRVPSDSVQRPARVLTKPSHGGKRHDSVTTKVPEGYNNKARSLDLPRRSDAATSSRTSSRGHDTGKQRIGVNSSDRTPKIAATNTTAAHLAPFGRKSVSSLFPHDVREEDWNLPLAKPPFRNGRGEGWTTADATQDSASTARSRGKR